MRRTAWLVLSPWLVVAVVSGVAWATMLILRELLTTDGGGLGNLGGELLAVLGAAVVWLGGSVALLREVARRTFAAPLARGAVRGAVVGAVVCAVPVAGTIGLLDSGGAPWVAGLVPVFLPAAGTVAFLVTERRLTGRVVPPHDGRRRAAPAALLVALAGALVGATAGVVVDVVVLGPSSDELGTAARGLVPPGYTVEDPVPINGTVLLSAHPPSSAPDAGDVEATVAAAGWRTDDVEREPWGTTLVVSRGDVEGTVLLDEDGIAPYTVTVRRRPVDGRGALAGGLLGAGAGAGAVGAIVRRRT
ncbi:hypothetical protein [Cellulomonas sp. KRMCY2]|uniref:hypothetical protein n=1 Tax=Cellulomonas sp. KRMCY2 TaxID=1304865 RepID=UPI00045EB2BA|nr:hypothetical protein [Cellulomonas sp. KRMCY2]